MAHDAPIIVVPPYLDECTGVRVVLEDGVGGDVVECGGLAGGVCGDRNAGEECV
jgi:hypothetical protein